MTVKGIPTEVLVAPDSFKGTFAAADVAAAIGRGVASRGRSVSLLPLADGGEGTLAVLRPVLGAELVVAHVQDPLGRLIEARFGIAPRARRSGVLAIVEMAAASGLELVTSGERDAEAASTYGTGQLIAAAAAAGARTIYVTVGGSATTDGGAGAIQAITDAGGLRAASLTVLCDVRTSFEDAARIYGPQKGAVSAAQVERLSERLQGLAATFPRDPRGLPLTGAAGGLSGGLWAVLGAELVPGAAFVLDALGFDTRMRAARVVVTGEGRLDHQSLVGKVVSEVATRARQAGVPCQAIVGRSELSRFDQRILDLEEVVEAGTLEELHTAGAALADRL